MDASLREAVAKTAQDALEAAFKETRPCERCAGRGYHHGFGDDGTDPDWCAVCGGCQFVGPTEEEAWLKAAAAILSLPQIAQVEEMRGPEWTAQGKVVLRHRSGARFTFWDGQAIEANAPALVAAGRLSEALRGTPPKPLDPMEEKP